MSPGYWEPEVRLGVPQPALTVNSDAASNVDQMTFSFNGTACDAPQVMVRIPATKIAVPLPVPEVSILRPPMALKRGLDLPDPGGSPVRGTR